MKLRITLPVLHHFPHLLVGIVIAKGVDNTRRLSAMQQLVRGALATRQRECAKQPQREALKLWHEVQKEKSRLEKVLDDAKKGVMPPSGTTIEDIALYGAFRHEVPVRCEDLDQVFGDIELGYADGGESFRQKGSMKLEHPESQEIIYRDKAGVLCRMWNAQECERTAPMPETKNAIFVVENLGFYKYEQMKDIMKEIGMTVQKYCKGSIEIHILGDRVSEVDLGVAGLGNASEAEPKQNAPSLLFHQKVLAQATKEKEVTPAAPIMPEEKITEPEEKIEEKPVIPAIKAAVEKAEVPPPKPKKPAKKFLVIDHIHDMLKNAALKAYSEIEETTLPEFSVAEPKDSSHGDYATNIAMVLAKTLKKAPQEIAHTIIEKADTIEQVESLTFAPPGFINIRMSKVYLETNLDQIIRGQSPYGRISYGKGETIIVEYSSPNVAKPLGAHHLITTILGQALYNIYKFLGYDAISINHIGDWGTQFGKIIVAYKLWGDKKIIEKSPIDELLKLYVKFHEEAEKPDGSGSHLEDEARLIFKQLEDGDKEIKKLWKWVVDISMKDVEKTYKALGGITFDYTQGESFYNDKMDAIIESGIHKKIFSTGEGGSLIAPFENEKMPPLLIKKSDGATLYATRDLAQMHYRIKTWSPEKILYVVDVAQSLHFQQLFEVMKKFAAHDETGAINQTELVHVSFGRMNFADKKMSTRKGNIIALNEVLKEAVQRAQILILEKDGGNTGTKKANPLLAQAIGVGAVKYNILSQNRITDIVFDWDRMLSLEGNSAPYIQYTYARSRSILKKSEEWKDKKIDRERQIDLFQAIESDEAGQSTEQAGAAHSEKLLRKLIQFPEALLRTAQEYKPNLLCQYLYELAQTFNAFYHSAPVLQTENKEIRAHRLKLVRATSAILEKGLELLGIEAPEKM